MKITIDHSQPQFRKIHELYQGDHFRFEGSRPQAAYRLLDNPRHHSKCSYKLLDVNSGAVYDAEHDAQVQILFVREMIFESETL